LGGEQKNKIETNFGGGKTRLLTIKFEHVCGGRGKKNLGGFGGGGRGPPKNNTFGGNGPVADPGRDSALHLARGGRKKKWTLSLFLVFPSLLKKKIFFEGGGPGCFFLGRGPTLGNHPAGVGA